jgi:hypothetical protein
VKDISKFSDDGVTFNGAYGYRWRRSWIDMEATAAFDMPGQNVDQLDTIIKHLSRTPHSRRAVLDMWQVQDDLLKVDTSKDVCCNLSAVFQIHGGDLHMTVYNRSNDVILGMLGANAVHFSYLQEYIANSLNLSMGPYTQVSCNAHVYKSHVDKYLHTAPTCHDNEYWDEIGTYWLDPATDFQFCTNVIDSWVQGNGMPLDVCDYFEDVLEPMCIAYAHHKARDYDSALRTALDIRDLQWANACIDWILRRKANWQRNTTLPPNTEGISPKELDDVQWMMGSGRYYQ